MWKDSGRGAALTVAGRLLVALALALLGAPSGAGEGRWRIQFEPMFMEATGNDRHVLDIRETRSGTAGIQDTTGVGLDTDAGPAFRLEVRYVRDEWAYGIDYQLFNTSQDAGPLDAVARGGLSEVAFEVSDATYSSTGPGERLFYDTLEDTDLETWSADLYAMRTLRDTESSTIGLRLGLRFADFDNDYHGVVGVRNVNGSFVDASSNYPLMVGPVLGLSATFQRGKNRLGGYLGQSVVFGSADLSSSRDDFIGSPDQPTITDSERFAIQVDEAIPMTELRFKWKRQVSQLIAVGAGIYSSVWWGVSVPPGVSPGPDRNTILYENTIVFFGISGVVDFSF